MPQEIESEPVSSDQNDYYCNQGPGARREAAGFFGTTVSGLPIVPRVRSMERPQGHTQGRRFPPRRSL
jgi:hypothetical protein